jgi:signal transduction histidine kinase
MANDNKENILRDSQLASLGKMLAGYSHELKNHLAIINESAGLMDDLLEMGSIDDEQSVQRFKKSISLIWERINQADTMAKYMNGFAHKMDIPVSNFDVNELLNEELAFLDRFFLIKSASLQKELQPDLPAVRNNPSLLQFVIFTYISRIIAGIDSGGEIAVTSQLKGQDILIIIEASNIPASAIDQDSSDEVAIKYALDKMGIAMTEETLTDDRKKTIITIPAA